MGFTKGFLSQDTKKKESHKTSQQVNAATKSLGGGTGRILYQAVVLDFFSNPIVDLEKTHNGTKIRDLLTASGVTQVENPGLVPKMPRGSVLAQVVSDNAANNTPANARPKGKIFFPLFPHMVMPVAPGERIWIIYETLNKNSIGYWFSRVSSDVRVDDINYTHKSREGTYSDGTKPLTDSMAYGFAPGGSKDEIPGEDPYNQICQESFSYSEQFTGEPVPRFSPRIGDLVIQGSNNTLICLGQDRADLSGPEKAGDHLEKSGTIDIVTGRGQNTTKPANEIDLAGTLSNDVRGYTEIDKAPNRSGVPQNEIEGNPDYTSDLSRVYVSSNTDGDAKFGGNVPSLEDTTGANSSTGPYVIVKSTHPRIIARSDGSVKIVHQGGSSISMDSSGNVQIITSGKISMGTSGADLQPFVRGEDLLAAVTALKDDLLLPATTLPTPAGPAPTAPLAATGQPFANFVDAVSESLSSVIKGE